jgi:CRISPR system Cascade subunit CasA
MTSFNLTTKPWIPVIGHNGCLRLVGIRDAVVQAHELVEISDEPPVTASLIRLLLAVVIRVLSGPASPEAWAEAWRAGRFDPAAVESYLGRWQDAFDLFHTERPFLQSPGLADEFLRAPSLLDPSRARGNNPTLFDHSLDDSPVPLSAAEAARWLVTTHAFAAGGLVSREKSQGPSANAAPLSGSLVFVVSGHSLFETLLLNTPIYDPATEQPYPALAEDLPAWEREPAALPRVRDPAGWLDLLTYTSRRVRLVIEAGEDSHPPLVTKVAVADGDRPGDGWSPRSRELAMAFRTTKTGVSPLRPAEDRDLWRDADALAGVRAETDPPKVVELVAERIGEGTLNSGTGLGLEAYTLATDRAKYLYWRHQRLPLPARLLVSEGAPALVGKAITTAEEVARHLSRALQVLVAGPAQANPQREERQRRERRGAFAMADYWAALTPGFDRFLVMVAEQPEEAMEHWSADLERAVEGCWAPWAGVAAPSVASYRRLAEAERHHRRSLEKARAFKEPSP